MKKEIKSELLNESYFEYTLENGLTVLIYPAKDKKNTFALLGAKIGSATGDFFLDGRRVTVPAGVAHFLEHKLFENETEDAFTLFSKTGANANAFTSFDRTCYLFSTSVNEMESLRILIDFVTSPHFTAETVEKEQGIIGQEIKMYDDNAEWVLFMSALRCLYSNIPLKEDIAGTVESIAEITPETLYDCYNAFYSPSNMVLSIAGNVDPDEVIRLCKEEYAKKNFKKHEVKTADFNEPREIAKKEEKHKLSIFEKQFCLGYKETPHSKSERMKNDLLQKVILDVICDETSSLYRELYDEGLINDMFEAGDLSAEDYLCFTFSGESKDPERVILRLKEEIARVKKEGIDAERFDEIKRSLVGSLICAFDNTEAIASNMLNCHFKGCGIYDIINTAKEITKEDAEKLLARLFAPERSAVSLVEPQ